MLGTLILVEVGGIATKGILPQLLKMAQPSKIA
jgi:hypothetical protein